MPMERVRQVVDQCCRTAARMGKRPFFYLTGGDPILHRHFWEILALLQQKGIPFSILGNPFHLDDEVCRRLKSFGCRTYQLSIDGLRTTHDMIRKEGSFDTTLEKIAVIKGAGLRASVMTTVSGTNIAEIPEIVDLVVEYGADAFAFGRYCPTSEEKSTHIAPEEYRDFLDRMWHKFEQHKNSGTVFTLKDHLWTLYLYEKGLFRIPDDADPDEVYDGCHCGACHMTITPTGDVMACRRVESTVGNMFRRPLHEIWEGAEMDAYRDYGRFEKCSRCELLRFCRGCPAVAYGYHRSFYAPDPQCWKAV